MAVDDPAPSDRASSARAQGHDDTLDKLGDLLGPAKKRQPGPEKPASEAPSAAGDGLGEHSRSDEESDASEGPRLTSGAPRAPAGAGGLADAGGAPGGAGESEPPEAEPLGIATESSDPGAGQASRPAVSSQRHSRPTPGFRNVAPTVPDEPARDADASTATASTPDVAATPAASSQQAPEPGPDANAPEATVASPRTAPNLRGSASAAFAGHGLTPLLPTEPSLGLAAILERDAVLNVPKGRLWQLIAAGCGLFGLFLAVVGAARHRAGIDVPLVGPIRLAHLGLILAMLAVWAFLTIRTVAGDKVLRIPLAPSQGDQWEEVQSQARLMQFGQWIGMGGAVAGLGILALSLRFIPGGGVVVGAGLGGAMAVGSLALILFMEARRGPLRQVYVQTLLLSRLEEAGVSSKLALDPRTAEVLRAVDRLLADLPESAVRRFMSTDQAQKYIELVEKAHRGGPDARR